VRSKLPLCVVYIGPEQYVRNKAEQLDHFCSVLTLNQKLKFIARRPQLLQGCNR
jgi:hypothetical protein